MSPTQAVIAVGLALLLAWALRPQPAPVDRLDSGLQVILPPMPLTGVSQDSAESILSRLQPTIRPRLFPLGWTVSWPSVEIPTDFGTAKVDLPPVELPFVPRQEVLRMVAQLQPQIVTTESGLAIQMRASVPL